jgi:hypothetical protein
MGNAKECPWALVKMIKIEILLWKMVKKDEFNYLKVKVLLNLIQAYHF